MSWDDSYDNKGVIESYTAHYFCADRNCHADDRQSGTTEHNYTITGLYPYTNYTIVILAWTIAGEGQGSKLLTITTIEAGEKS